MLPNLEQCGLLRIGYRDLEAYAGQDAGWASIPGLDHATPAGRLEILQHVLDYFRRQFALAHKDLEEGALREQERHIRERLRAPWTLDDKERLPDPRYHGAQRADGRPVPPADEQPRVHDEAGVLPPLSA